MLKKMKKTPLSIVLFTAVIICMLTFSLLSVNFSSVLYILISGTVGVLVYTIGLLRERRARDK